MIAGYKSRQFIASMKKLWLTYEKEAFIITYGKEEMAGILDFGYPVDLTYEDLVRSWKQLKGFEYHFISTGFFTQSSSFMQGK